VRAGEGVPKQYRPLAGRPVLAWSLDAFLAHPNIDRVLVVIADSDREQFDRVASHNSRMMSPVLGGNTRQDSVRLGLEALAKNPPDRVLVHDAARPFVSGPLVARVIAALDRAEAALPVLPVTDTLKLGVDDLVTRTVPRDHLYAAQTPQGFRFHGILAAHDRAAQAGLTFTDDAAIAEWAGIPVRMVAGEPANVKLTTLADIDSANRRLATDAALALGEVRVGTGYDIHVLGPGAGVTLGGVAIPYDRGLVGHSDADVGLHALTDAILGALADGDIGVHFPPSDPTWRGAASEEFLRYAAARVAARGGRIAHLDLAIIAEAPRIGPYRDQIRERIAAICGIEKHRVGVKATTNEGLGAIGRGEGIAAIATATLRLPFGDLE
jgi:2-C-methyl-D-erythritol 4-phosphate cytidylyltransferase/2-C-methyl-D-erythritol 2,4-cyclodiphosphate synthase